MAVLLVIMIAVLVAADQLVKYWCVQELKPVGSMDFIHFGSFKVFDLTYLENRGAIFGSMAGQRWFLIGFTSLIVVAGFAAMFIAVKKSRFLAFVLGLFVAGGIGNLIDRIRLGYVVDMFELKLLRFAIFNVADICVTIAFVLALIYFFLIDSEKDKEKKKAESHE